jgi:hypothetical protein
MLSKLSLPEARHYSEIHQNNPVKFAYYTVEGDTLVIEHHPVKCRDFLTDTLLWDCKEKKAGQIYGFEYAGPLPKDKLQLAIIPTTKQNFKDNLHLLNEVEKRLKIKPTTFQEVGEWLALEADPFWLRSTLTLSWYTATIRLLNYSPSSTLTALHQENYSEESGALPKLDIYLKLPFALAAFQPRVKAWSAVGSYHDCNGIKSAELGIVYAGNNEHFTFKPELVNALQGVSSDSIGL